MFSDFTGSERTRRESLAMTPTPFTEMQTQIPTTSYKEKANRNSVASELSVASSEETFHPTINMSWAKIPDASLEEYRPKSRRRKSPIYKVTKIIKSLRSVCSYITRHWTIRRERQQRSGANGEDHDTTGVTRGIGGRGLMERERIFFSGLDMVAATPTETEAVNQFTTTMEPPPPYDAMASAHALPSRPSLSLCLSSTAASPCTSGCRDAPSTVATATNGTGGHPNPMTVQRQSQVVFDFGRLFLSPVTVRFTFMPKNEDELELTVGEKLRIIAIFDDGWCLCRTEGGKGAVPLACLDITSRNEPTGVAGPCPGLPESMCFPNDLGPPADSVAPAPPLQIREKLTVSGGSEGGCTKCRRSDEVGMVPATGLGTSRSTRFTSLSLSR